jgi:hypothetical protein
MSRLRFTHVLALPVCLIAIAAARPAKPTTVPATQPSSAQTGSFQLTFTERSPLSELPVYARRMGATVEAIKALKAPLTYDIANESFQAYVPQSYTGAEPYGLFVWVSAGPRGNIPEPWLEVFDRHKLIAVGADNDGNNRELWNRMHLALDAVHNMKTRYRIDPSRVYVGGGSGGGKTASHLAIGYPDVFRGGFYVVGVNYFRNVPVESKPRELWPAGFAKPARELFKLATTRGRHVLLTGDNDMNRAPTHDTYGAFKADGFKYVTYIQVPGMGHGLPDGEWFEKGIDALDEPLPQIVAELDRQEYKEPLLAAKAARPTTAPSAKATADKVASTAAPTSASETRPAPTAATGPAADAEREMRGAKLYLNDRRLYPKARERLKRIIDTYPGTPAAEEAATLMRQIEGR